MKLQLYKFASIDKANRGQAASMAKLLRFEPTSLIDDQMPGEMSRYSEVWCIKFFGSYIDTELHMDIE
jgi:hypothetical protein